MNKSEFKLMLCYPYVSFESCQYVFKKIKDLSEMEAITLTFIYLNKDSTELFLDLFNKTFNLVEKWNSFTMTIIKNLINDNVIKLENQTELKDARFFDFQIHPDIEKLLKKGEFKGLETKAITRNWPFYLRLYNRDETVKQWFENKNGSMIIENINMNNFIEREFDNLKTQIQDKVIEKKDSDYSLGNTSVLINIKNISHSLPIVFYPFPKNVGISTKNKELNISTNDKNLIEYIKWVQQKEIETIIKFSFEHQLKILNLLEIIEINDDVNDFEYWDINEYQEIKKKISELSFYSNEKNLIIQDSMVYKLHFINNFIKFDISSIQNTDKILIPLIVKTKYMTIDEFVIKLLDERYYDKALELVKINKNNSKINNYLLSQEQFIKDADFSKYKDYIIENLIIENTISEKYWKLCFEYNSVSENDWQKIIKNNFEKSKQYLYSLNDEMIKNDLTNKKLIFLLLQMDINLLEEENIKCDIKTKLQKYLDNLKSLEMQELNSINYEMEYNLLKNNIKEIILNDKALKWFDSQFRRNNEQLERLKDEDWRNLSDDVLRLTNKMDEFNILNNNKDFYQEIGKLLNQTDKEYWEEIRKFRNSEIHKTNQQNAHTVSIIEITNKRAKCKEYIEWLEQNKERIIETIQNNLNQNKDLNKKGK